MAHPDKSTNRKNIMNSIQNITDLGNWWSLSEAVQETIKKTVPDKSSWTLHITKTKQGDWVFSLPQFLTFNEALTGGTEKVIDYHYKAITGKEAVTGDKMTMTVSSKELPDFTTTLLFWDKDVSWPDSHWYVDSVSDGNVWLCPYLQVLFKKVPGKMWVKFAT